jgi:hypothetical protein
MPGAGEPSPMEPVTIPSTAPAGSRISVEANGVVESKARTTLDGVLSVSSDKVTPVLQRRALTPEPLALPLAKVS